MSVSTLPANAAGTSKHFTLLKQTIGDHFQTAAPERIQALARSSRKIEPWHVASPELDESNKAAWITQNAADEALVQTQDARTFAEPLLRRALREKYAVNVDVRTTHLLLYIPKNGSWGLPDPLGGITARSVSLLDAALHNFAVGESFIEKDSAFTSQPDARGQFTIQNIQRNMTIKQFMTLCRELDIGKQYQAHLKQALKPIGVVDRLELKNTLKANEKSMFANAAAMALAKGDISENAHSVVTGLMAGNTGLTLLGKVTEACDLSLLGTLLTGIVVFGPVTQQATGDDPIVVYVPHDPEHPFKQYDSWKAFIRELARQLRENKTAPSSQISYRQFFSQFVDQQQRGHFFAGLQSRLTTPTFHRDVAPDQRPAWRDSPVEQPDLQFVRTAFTGDLAAHLFQSKLDKVLKDAREIAISTADADSHARKAWWDNFAKIAWDIFNVALMVATPFVPGLGEIMLAYSAFQLGTEVITGVVDLAEGQWKDAIDHLVGVVDQVAQAAAMVAGFKAGKPLLNKASAFVDGLLPVKMAGGETRLWNPDLKPYQLKDVGLATAARPEANGLHPFGGKQILRVDEQHYEVARDSKTGRHRIQHPQRADAYMPEVRLNGAGAYAIETEQPRTWEDAMLLRRLSPSAAALSDIELQTARQISGTDTGELRRMYVENRQPPVLLNDTLIRLDIDRSIETFIEQMRSDDPAVYGKADSVTQLQIMTQHGMWPENASMRVIDGAGKQLWEHSEPLSPPGKKLIVQLQERQLLNGELLSTVMATLDHNGTAVILDQPPGTPVGSLATRTQALRQRIVEIAERERQKLFDADYASREDTAKASNQIVRNAFPEIPAQGIDNLLALASESERKVIEDEARLPLHLKRIAQELQLETRTARSYEGFYRDALISADTERLVLNALRIHSDALGEVRLEIRQDRFDGELICKAGPAKAKVVRILVKGTGNTYEVRDPANTRLHEAADLYRAVLQALPDEQRQNLGYLPREGAMFKQWVMVKLEPPFERRIALDPRDPPPPVPTQDLLLLRGPMLSRSPRTLDERVADLYPHFSPREVSLFVKSLTDQGDASETLMRLEQELGELRDTLNSWLFDHIVDWGMHSSDFIMTGGKYLADQMLECFERRSEVFGKQPIHSQAGYALDLSSEVPGYDLERWWKKLPEQKKYAKQIDALNVDNVRLRSKQTGLLDDFRHVRQLSARNCELPRLPASISNMQALEALRLSENKIRLKPEDVERLRHLTRMEILRLDDNPLGAQINIGRMPRLKVLSLNNTGIQTWPEGIFNHRRPRSFFLDMQQNPITEIPDVPAGSDQAFIIARTRIFTLNLTDANRLAYEAYRTSVGFNAHHFYSTKANKEMARWPVYEDRVWHNHAGLGTYRQEAWGDLATEPESKGFFKVIEKLRQSADYLADGEPRMDLSDRVWRTIEAGYLDHNLRDELFLMSTSPTSCADAGAQLFNNMGIKVLASEARSSATTAAELQTSMVTLARGAARLEAVGEIARSDMLTRTQRADEVEVHMAYETNLAERLGLPWQSKNMLYRQIAQVSEQAIDRAYDKVIADEQGDGLVDRMLDLSIWSSFLEEAYPAEYQQNALTFQDKIGQLEDLRRAQEQWADAADMAQAQKASLRQQMTTLAKQIPVSESLIFTGAAMTEEAYGQISIDLGEQKKELGRRLTRAALKEAGL
ncbi:NEL-type E3 ubiquitin ligase domain-containing protein [Pseudomonas sp. WC2]|uniref:NEL-type E3 ubiquitin ligase domain-containing protein n=1 Tax=Pseudomonas sp. WC2 TaxID=3424773 RepID=UPI003D32D435